MPHPQFSDTLKLVGIMLMLGIVLWRLRWLNDLFWRLMMRIRIAPLEYREAVLLAQRKVRRLEREIRRK